METENTNKLPPQSPPNSKPANPQSNKRPRSLFETPITLDSMVKSLRPQQVQPRFLTITCATESNSFLKISAVAITKAIQGLAGTVKSAKKLRNGSLLVETANDKQSESLLKSTTFANLFPIVVKPHAQLNNCKGIISCPDLVYVTDEELTEELSRQGCGEFHRIMRRVDGTLKPTSTIILTFNTLDMPAKVIVGFHILNVRTYIPNPMRCFHCQRFGHTKNVCKNTQLCRSCGLDFHGEVDCTEKVKCVNCQGPHESSSRDCPKWTEEKKICEFMAVDKVSLHEARRRYRLTTPNTNLLVSFAQAASSTRAEAPAKPDETAQLREIIKNMCDVQKQLQLQLKDQANQIKQQSELIKELLLTLQTTKRIPPPIVSTPDIKKSDVTLPSTPSQSTISPSKSTDTMSTSFPKALKPNLKAQQPTKAGKINRKTNPVHNTSASASLHQDMVVDPIMDDNPYNVLRDHHGKTTKSRNS
jgi:hypothetical protein